MSSSINLPGWPNSYTGEEGDAYSADDTSHIWVWGEDSSWHDIGQIQGPQGPEGPSGQKGNDGTDGKGWTSGAYNATNGIVTFASDDGLGFNTGDLRGANGQQGGIGPEGPEGEDGPKGEPGTPGVAATVAAGITTTLAPSVPANVTNVGTTSAAVFNFEIPRGYTGSTGNPGESATLDIGFTNTGSPGTNATVTNTGTPSAGVFNFTIPRGDKGDDGVGKSYNIEASASGVLDLVDEDGSKSSVTFVGGDNIDVSSNASSITVDADLTLVPAPVVVKNYSDVQGSPFQVSSGAGASMFAIGRTGEVTGNGQMIRSIGDPVLNDDAATKGYVDAGVASGVSLGNVQPWTHGQYNTTYSPPKTSSGFSTRFNWDAETYPSASLQAATEPAINAGPQAPTVDGMFMSITWVSNGDANDPQVWALEINAFAANAEPPVDEGKDVVQVFVSANNKWMEVG